MESLFRGAPVFVGRPYIRSKNPALRCVAARIQAADGLDKGAIAVFVPTASLSAIAMPWPDAICHDLPVGRYARRRVRGLQKRAARCRRTSAKGSGRGAGSGKKGIRARDSPPEQEMRLRRERQPRDVRVPASQGMVSVSSEPQRVGHAAPMFVRVHAIRSSSLAAAHVRGGSMTTIRSWASCSSLSALEATSLWKSSWIWRVVSTPTIAAKPQQDDQRQRRRAAGQTPTDRQAPIRGVRSPRRGPYGGVEARHRLRASFAGWRRTPRSCW